MATVRCGVDVCCAEKVRWGTMLERYSLKGWVSWPMVRAHASSLAVCMSLNSWWRVPRDAFRYGGLSYALTVSAALLVAAPVALLQLAAGQLSQQDAVGVWRAVPFFTGVGYLRLLVTSLGSIYTSVYLALVATNFFNILGNSQPSMECTELFIPQDIDESSVFGSSMLCFNETMFAPIAEQPESFVAIALIIVALWIVCPLMLYSPVKYMKCIFYVLGPVVLILAIVIVSCIGDWKDLLLIQKASDWSNFTDADIWYAAFVQALWSAQVAGGFLVSSGDTIYTNTDVQWTTVIIVTMNIISSWLSITVWFAIGGAGEKDLSPVAVIYQVFISFETKQLDRSWILVIFAMLFFSGMISMLTLLYPLYDRFYRIGEPKWRFLTGLSSLIGGGSALAVLAGGLPVLHVLDDIATPLLITLATIIEIFAFVFIYGWKILVEDIEFLSGQPLSKCWVMGWCAALGIIAPFSAWWVAVVVIQDRDWREMPWEAATLIAAAGLALLIFVVFAAVAVSRQVQYDCIGKLKASFKPSRQWGPRDPITHYYWVARRDEPDRSHLPRSRYSYHRRYLGRLSRSPSSLYTVPTELAPQAQGDVKCRANSDDWIYTVQRRRNLDRFFEYNTTRSKRRRSKSLDWDLPTIVGSKPNKVIHTVEFSSKQPKKMNFIATDKKYNNNNLTKT